MTELQTAFNPQNQEIAEEKPLLPLNMQYCPPCLKKRAIHIMNTMVEHSPIGRELMENVVKEGYQLQMFCAGGWSGMVDKENKYLFLNAACTDNELIETLAHEARHIQQFSRGVDYGCGAYALKESIMLHRAKEADAETTAAAVCHQIKVNGGIEGPWQELEAEKPDLALGFKNAAKEPNSPVTHEMLRGGFDGWFKNTKIVKIYEDNYILNGILNECWNRDVNPKDFFFKKESSAEIVQKVCHDADGKCYWSNKPDVLEEPHRLLVNQATIDKADRTFASREQMGFIADYAYRNLPTREAWKETEKQKEAKPAVQTALVAKVLANRNR